VTALRIGIACFSTFGGSGVVAAEIGMSLARRGHSVWFIGDGVPGRADRAHPNVTVREVVVHELPPLRQGLYTLALASAMVEIAGRERLDILHAHYAVPHAISAHLAREVMAGAGGRAPRLVTTLHGTDITLVGVDPSFLPLTRFAILSSDALTVPSAWLKETTYRNLDIPRAVPIDVLPNFVDTTRFSPSSSSSSSSPPVLTHVSNFRPLKRVGDVVRVFARLRAEQPAELRLVGDGPERPAVAALARELGVAADVRFLGEGV